MKKVVIKFLLSHQHWFAAVVSEDEAAKFLSHLQLRTNCPTFFAGTDVEGYHWYIRTAEIIGAHTLPLEAIQQPQQSQRYPGSIG